MVIREVKDKWQKYNKYKDKKEEKKERREKRKIKDNKIHIHTKNLMLPTILVNVVQLHHRGDGVGCLPA